MSTTDFYEQIDVVFEKLYSIYGINENLIEAKSKILKFYIEKSDDSDVIVKQLTKKYFKINEYGNVISVN